MKNNVGAIRLVSLANPIDSVYYNWKMFTKLIISISILTVYVQMTNPTFIRFENENLLFTP